MRLKVLDHGFVNLLRVDGDDHDIAEAARTSTGKTNVDPAADARLIDRLVRDDHASPLEQVGIQVSIQLPIFVMRQLVRHRVIQLNEFSGRYSEMLDLFYVPELERMQAQSTFNKQGSAEMLLEVSARYCRELIKENSHKAYNLYQCLLQEGLTRELARIVLPVNFYTRITAKISVRGLFDFLRLRMDGHAQYEIRVYAEAMYEILKATFPASADAFDRHIKDRRSVSNEALRLLLSGQQTDDPEVNQIRKELGL